MKKIAYLVSDLRNPGREDVSGWKFLRNQKKIKGVKLSFFQLSSNPSILGHYSALWWHFGSSTCLPPIALNSRISTALRNYVRNGGSLLLSLFAAQYVVDLGIEEIRPNLINKGAWNEESWQKGYPDIRGISSFQGHPVFSDLHGAAYTWAPEVGREFSACCYEDPFYPKNGSVVAVERQYLRLNENRRVVTEYNYGRGRILTVGTYMFFSDPRNRFRPHLERFTLNCLEYLIDSQSLQISPYGRDGARKTHWSFEPPDVRFAAQTSRPSEPRKQIWKTRESGLKIERETASDNFFDVGGGLILIMGTERNGIEEVWTHPARILRNLRLGFKVGTGEPVGAETSGPRVVVRPESLVRIHTIDKTTIAEHIFANPLAPSGAIHFEVSSDTPVEILLTGQIDLRLMWPLSERPTGSLSYCWDDGLQAVVVRSHHGDFSIVGCSLSPSEYIVGHYEDVVFDGRCFRGRPTERTHVAFGIRVSLPPGDSGCTVAFSGSDRHVAIRTFREIVKNPLECYNSQVQHFKSLRDLTQITTPDPDFNEGYRWALVGLDRFYVSTPSWGISLMAGYGTTDRGWNGGHLTSGRPGYAWYFGRDTVWASLALLDCGDFHKVRSVLQFLGTYQDITGKILHEFTTSGHVHYDAADSTPLYVLLMGRYLRATGDKEFVKREYPRLVKAIEFCFSTDADHDGLIENTNVGHGWIEGGKLFPVHAELYLNACWAAALREAGYVAQSLRKRGDVGKWSKRAKLTETLIRNKFWNPETMFYNSGKNTDGSYITTRTIFPAVAMYFGQTDPKNTLHCLDEYASSDFSTEWGVRMVSRRDTMYNPEGYHEGSVWPLFTGWTSLAEFRYNRPDQGYKHLMNNLLLYKHWSAGYVPEVLHGERFEPAGVCMHQAWSESMVLQPILEGMLGLRMDSLKNALQLRPYFPPQWKDVEVRNIRLGSKLIHFSMRRMAGRTVFRFRSDDTKQIAVQFQPLFPIGTEIRGICIGGKTAKQKIIIDAWEGFPILHVRFSKRFQVDVVHSTIVS